MTQSAAGKSYGVIDDDRQRALSGLEFVQGLVDGTLPLNSMAETLGYDIVEVAKGRVVAAATPHAGQRNPAGTVHGGLAATLLDSAMGLAVQSMLDKGFAQTTLEFKISLLSADHPADRPGEGRRQGHQLRTPCRYRRGKVNGAGRPRSRARHNDVLDLRALNARRRCFSLERGRLLDRGPICKPVENCVTAPLRNGTAIAINREASMLVRAMKMAAVVVSLAVMLLGAATPSQAQTTGTVRLHIVKVGFIIGVGGGNGVLFYNGHRYRLSVGIGLGSLGIAAVDLVGTASNMTSPGAIAGTYGGAGAGGSFVGGGQVATLQNGNGVVLQLRGVQAGFQVSLGLGGMTLSLR